MQLRDLVSRRNARLFCGEPDASACAAITGMTSKYFSSQMPYCFGEGTCSSRLRP